MQGRSWNPRNRGLAEAYPPVHFWRRSLLLFLALLFLRFVPFAAAQSNELANGDIVSGTINTQTDNWTVSASAGNFVVISIWSAAPSPGSDFDIRIDGPDGTEVYHDFDQIFARYTGSAATGGTYAIKVSRHGTGTDRIAYSLTSAVAPGSFALPSQDEGGPMTSGQNYTGQVYRGDVDAWTFKALSGDSFYIGVSSAGTTTSDPEMYVVAPDGTLLDRDFNMGFIRYTDRATQSGTYTVIICRHNSDDSGSYAINTVVTSGAIIPVGDEGGFLANGIPGFGTVHKGDVDPWTFTATAGSSYSVSANASGGDFNIYIFNPDGSPAYASFGTSLTATRTAPATGLYTVLIAQHNQTDLGDYSLFVTGTGVGADPSPPAGKQLGKNRNSQTCQCFRGEPIDVATGNLYEEATDYTTAGPNALSFMRYYNSLASTQSATFASTLGVNWRSTFDRYLRIAPSSVMVERPDGRIFGFALKGGAWTTDSDVDATLSHAGSVWTFTDGNDTVETYTTLSSGEAVLSAIKLRNGYTQTLSYSGALLASVTDSFNRQLAFTYKDNLLSTATTPDGLVLTYEVTPVSKLLGYLVVAGAQLTSVAYSTSPVTKQTYLYEDINSPFGLTGLIDENGSRYSTWSYDNQGRAISSQLAGGANVTRIFYDDATGNRTVTNALGEQETYKFTTLQNVPKVTEIDRLASGSLAAAKRTFGYDSNGYLSSTTDWNGNRTTYTNDARGEPVATVEAAGTAQARTTTITYHPTFHLPTNILQAGITSGLAYDSSGNLLTRTLTDTTTTTAPYASSGQKRTWTYSWGSYGLLTSAKGPRGDVDATTGYTYDASGALTGTNNALGQAVQITQHLPGGLPQTMVDANGVTTQLTYDDRQRLTSRAVSTTAGPLTTRYSYDPAGNLVTTTLPDGSALTNSYEAAHRLTAVTDLFGQSTAYTLNALGDRTQTQAKNAAGVVKQDRTDSYDALGRLSQDTGGAGQVRAYGYDGDGNAVSLTDPLNRTTAQSFDALNRLATITDPANGVTTTSYDAHDRPLTVTAPNNAVTSYVYDGFGDLIQTTSPDTGKTVYRYDAAGNLAQKVDAAGAITNLTYDALNRVLTKTFPADAAESVAYTYDQAGHGFGMGQLTSVSDAVGMLSRSYDERGNLLAETRQSGSATLQTAYGYDAASRMASLTYPSGAAVAYSRDAMGRVTALTLLPKSSITAQPIASALAYQPFGPLNALTFGNGIQESRSFDLDARLTGLADTGAGPIQSLSYGYDAADNVVSLGDAVMPATSQNFAYDALDRLTGASGVYGTQGFTYDPAGNRLSFQMNGTTTAYSYAPQSNRLTQLHSGSAVQVVNYTGAGNISTIATAGKTAGATGVTYNQAGRLASVIAGGAQLIQYSYDAFDQRIVKIGAITAKNLYQYDQAGHLLETTDSQGHPQADYIYLGDRPIATVQAGGGQLYFLHDDRLGTPQAATNSAQAVVWKASYEPFGNASVSASAIVQDLRLPGQEFEIETGWHHNGFRDYVPGLGRYLESDPIGLQGGSNTYVYTGSKPERFIDPSGLASPGLSTILRVGRFGGCLLSLCAANPDPVISIRTDAANQAQESASSETLPEKLQDMFANPDRILLDEEQAKQPSNTCPDMQTNSQPADLTSQPTNVTPSNTRGPQIPMIDLPFPFLILLPEFEQNLQSMTGQLGPA